MIAPIFFITIFIFLVYICVYGIIDLLNQNSKIKDDEPKSYGSHDDLLKYRRGKNKF
jgi:hypothetical protein